MTFYWPLTIASFDPGHHHGDQGFSGVDPVLHDMFHEGFACEVLVFTSADNRAEVGMGLILAKRKCNSGSVCLESLTDAEFFLNLRDMSTWKKYTNSYNYCSLQATRILFIRFYKKH